MPYRGWVAGVCAIMMVCMASSAAAQIRYEREHEGTWFSFFLDTQQGGEGRTLVTPEPGSEVSLRLDFWPDNCAEVSYMAILEPRPRGTDRRDNLEGRAQLRVDRRTIHEGLSHMTVLTRDEMLETALFFSNPGAVLSDLREGTTVRVKVDILGESAVVAFPLDGSAAAIERAQALCEEYGEDNESYFEDAPHEDYFQ